MSSEDTKWSERRWRLKLSLANRLLAVTAVLLVALAGAIFLSVRQTVETAMYREIDGQVATAQNTLWYMVKQKGPAAIVDGKLTFGAWVANDDFSVVDSVKELTGSTATLFQLIDDKQVRVTTNVPKPDGSGRAVGTVLAGPAAEAIARGESYRGVVPILGINYITRYDPIRDASGKVIGVVYSGVPLTTLYATTDRAVQVVFIITLLGLAVGLAVLFAILRSVGRAIKQVRLAAEGLAEGDIEQTITVRRSDEIGDLAESFRRMIGYQQQMTAAAEAISQGDLAGDIEPKSERDVLGQAFRRMLRNLRELIGEVQATADGLANTSHEFGAAAEESGRAVGQVSQAVQEMASGAYQQASTAQTTSRSVEQLLRSIEQVAHGAQGQATR